MNTPAQVCLIGDVIVDVMMTEPVKMRLGGIFHAARACWALGVPFHILYMAPEYLVEDIHSYASKLGAASIQQVGHVTGCPNVVVIKEATEAGSQGYEYLLRDQYRCELASDLAGMVPVVSDVLVFPGGYDLVTVLKSCKGKGSVSVDIANWNGKIDDLLGLEISSLISSTSSPLFVEEFSADVKAFATASLAVAETLLFKENRGGTRVFRGDEVTQVGAQLRPIAHSVGVGDCYNVAFLVKRRDGSDLVAGNFASRVAAEYAATTYPDEFEVGVQTALAAGDNVLLGEQGISIPWEIRSDLNVYIAAPDFDYNDRGHINAVADALKYHNFRPRLPVRENGQASLEDNFERKQALFQGDMQLLVECQIVVVVLIDSDPGTLIELGLAAGMGMHTVVYDPHGIASNVMLVCLPNAVCRTLDEVISAVFTFLALRARDGN